MQEFFEKAGIKMKKQKYTMHETNERIGGKIKEVAGELTGNEQLEFKGKMQMARVEIKKKMGFGNNVENAKENVAKKMNHIIDQHKENKQGGQ